MISRWTRKITVRMNTMYLRIVLTKVTLAFFLFSFLHCFIHAIVQSLLFSLDANADDLVISIASAAQVPHGHLPYLRRQHDNYTLDLCSHVPIFSKNASCITIFQSGSPVTEIPSNFRREDSSQTNSDEIFNPVFRVDESGFGGDAAQVQAISGPTGDPTSVFVVSDALNGGEAVNLDLQCTRVLVYADQVLANSKREELALLGSEFWLLGISVFAILYDSIPHLLAGLFMRVLSTGWSAYAIWRTSDIQERFKVLITEGACDVDLFPLYFKRRMALQIPDLTLNVIALLVSCFLVLRLAKSYALYSFKRVGAPESVMGLYKTFLGVFICLQLSVYLLVTSAALWIDQLINGAIARISSHTTVYLGLFIFTVIVLVPWISMGWFAVRRELKTTMFAYLSIGFTFLSCWAIMYYSQVFRWTWLQWPFFAAVTVAAQLVLVASFILGVICWRNFDKGLAHYFFVDSLLEAVDFEPEVFSHKVDKDVEKQLEKDNIFTITLPSLAKTSNRA